MPSHDDTPDTRDRVAARPAAVLGRLRRGDDLLHHGSIMAVATIVSGGCNYAYQVFVGRALGPEQYGVFGALFALFYLVSVLGRGIALSATRFAAELDGDQGAVAAFHRGLLDRSLAFGAVLFVALAVASPTLAGFLGVASPWPVVSVAATVPFALALTVNQGTLQGLQWFLPLGSYRVLQAVLKLAVGAGLVATGYGVYGAFGGLGLAAVGVVVVSTVHVRRGLAAPSGADRAFDYARTYQFALPAVLAGFCLTVPATIDVILVKHSFASHQAGRYAAASVLGKALIFLALAVCGALFPKVSNGHAADDDARLDALFDRAFLYAGAVTGAGALVYWTVPGQVLGLLFGPAYVDGAAVLRWYGLAVFAFSLAAVALNFQLARDRHRFVYAFTALTVLEVGLLWAWHATPVRVVQVMLSVNLLLLAAGFAAVKLDR